ncbi:MAG: hypothetical protein ACM30D_01275 [Hyphomicrobiales bacterium]
MIGDLANDKERRPRKADLATPTPPARSSCSHHRRQNHQNERPKVARVALGAHLGLRDVVARPLPEPLTPHPKSNAGLRARASGGASVGVTVTSD